MYHSSRLSFTSRALAQAARRSGLVVPRIGTISAGCLRSQPRAIASGGRPALQCVPGDEGGGRADSLSGWLSELGRP